MVVAATGARIPVAVVGCGAFGTKHAERYARHPQATLAAIVDPHPAAADVARRLGASWFPSLDALPAGLVRAATVAVPDAAHEDVGGRLLRAGVDVLLEKPIALRLEGADALIALALRERRILQIGHVERFNPAVLAIPRGVAIRHVRTLRRCPLPVRATPSDVVLDLMIHDLDLVAAWCGGTPAVIAARGARGASGVIDRAEAQMLFPNGATATLIAERGTPRRVLEIAAAERRLYVDCLQRRLYDGNRLLPVSDHDALAAEIDAFLRAVRERAVPLVTGGAARAALALALTIREHILAARADSAA